MRALPSLFRPAVLALSAAAALAPAAAFADFPERPIKYILSSGPGSGPDSLVRLLMLDVGKRLGQTVVVENRPGGAGLIALQGIANADPDGYTIGHGNTQTLGISPGLTKANKEAADRLQYVVQYGYTPNLLSVTPSLPIKSVADLVRYAKANPGKLTYASAGNGTSSHVGAELFKHMTGTNIVHVPYKTAPAGVNDVVAGHVDVVFENMAGSLPLMKSGKLNTLGITSIKRSDQAPNVPTVDEAGVSGFEVIAWSGIVAPKGVPADVVEKINKSVNASLKDPQIIKRMHELGYEIVGGTPAQFEQWVAKERAKWAEVIRVSGARTD